MFLLRLCLLLCVNLFLYAKRYPPEELLCVSSYCNETISLATAKMTFLSPGDGQLGFTRGQNIQIIGKSKGANDYWRAIVNGKIGYVFSDHVKENKILHETNKLIPVVVSQQKVSFKGNSADDDPSNKNKLSHPQQSQTAGALPNNLNNVKTIEKPIEPAAPYTVVEGTTIYLDKTDDINPSATIDLKSTSTATTTNVKANKESQQEERATIPPELLNLNSNFNVQNLKNNNFTIENVKENDENTIIESKDIYAGDEEGEDDDDGEEGEEEEEEDKEEEDEGEDSGDDLSESMDNKLEKGQLADMERRGAAGEEKRVNPAPNNEFKIVTPLVPEVEQNMLDSTFTVKNSVTSQVSISVGDGKIEVPMQQKTNQPSEQFAGAFAMNSAKPQAIISEFPSNGNTPTSNQEIPQVTGDYASTPQVNVAGPKGTAQGTIGAGPTGTPQGTVGAGPGTPQATLGTGTAGISQGTIGTGSAETPQGTVGAGPGTPQATLGTGTAGTPQGTVGAGPGTPQATLGTGTAGIPQGTIGTGSAGTPQATIGTGPAGTPQGTIGTGTAGTPQGMVGPGHLGVPQGTLGTGSAETPQATIGTGPAGTPQATLSTGSAGIPQGTIGTGTAGTPQGMVEPGPLGTPQGTLGTGSAGTPQATIGTGPAGTPQERVGAIPEVTLQGTLSAEPTGTPQGTLGTGPAGTLQERVGPIGTPQGTLGTGPEVTPQERVGAGTEVTPQGTLGSEPAGTPQGRVEIGPEGTPQAILGTESAGALQFNITTGSGATPQVLDQIESETSAATPAPATPSQVPENFPREGISEKIPETFYTTPQSLIEEPSSIFSQFTVSADTLPDNSKDQDKLTNLSEIVDEKMEETTEAFATTHQPVVSETGYGFSESSPLPNIPDITPDSNHEKVEETTEAFVASSVPPETVTEQAFPKEELKEFENTETPVQTSEDNLEQQGMLSQLTGVFSSWFTSAPREEFPEEKPNYDAAFQGFTTTDKREGSESEAPPGTCQNPELGVDCKEFASYEEQSTFWSDWIPLGMGFENILRQSNTPVYLVITAVTVLLFTLGHNFIEKRGKTGPLIAKINKLEQELLVVSKECILFKDEVQSAREKITLSENAANDELVASLQAELEESKRVRSELESSIEVLQQELDAATEAGLDLNKMLSEVLTQKGGSESLLKSVESLQGQLDSQQKVIDEMTKKLGVKNQENEALQSALDAANDRTENLEEQLTDIKHNLNLHLKEKEDVTRDLNAQLIQLAASTNQMRQAKEEEISKLKNQLGETQKKLSESSSSLTVKEEEVKALKESMKHLKGKGEIKMETVFDFSRVKAELAKETKENQALLEKLKKEEDSKKGLTEQVNSLEGEVQKLKKNYDEVELKRDEAEKKLEVLSTYFKEKETQLQKELGLQEALWAQKKGDEDAVCNMIKSLQEEVECYKSQNETLKKEILDQERGLKNQIAGLEQKAHENWIAARQAERKLEEAKQEMSQLRNRLITVMDKNGSNAEGKGGLRSEELNGVEAASPILHDASSPLLFPPPLPLDPNSSNLLPPGFISPHMFMPPPMGGFMPPPPFLPGDRRPPPLGRMSSPPLNNRFSPSSPGDYPFERMSSPPLSPPGSNYRSLNEDREHYRHRTPPYPPPLHPRNWDDGHEMPGFIPISSQRDSRRDHKGSNVSSEHSSSESLDKSSRHSGRV